MRTSRAVTGPGPPAAATPPTTAAATTATATPALTTRARQPPGHNRRASRRPSRIMRLPQLPCARSYETRHPGHAALSDPSQPVPGHAALLHRLADATIRSFARQVEAAIVVQSLSTEE